jgi:cytochrome c-type biogenesis protein CcmF
MIVDVGYVALLIAMVVSIYVVVGSFLGASQRIPELILSARYGFYTVPFLLFIVTFALVYSFVTHDFSVRYVAENSNLAMPWAYTWVAFYAGNAGSLLFIALVFSVLSVVAVLSIRRNLPYTTPYTVSLLALVLAFFLAVMLFLANPLDRLDFLPSDGRGINPLLVHFGMFIHPPIQMLGLISVAIPFSIGIGALLAKRGGRDEWVDAGRTWGLFSWLILTLGLMLGSWWAYTILGWGGYWAWDPVENSALMPWLAMTAFVHSIMVQRRRGMFRMWNIVLIIVAFTLAEMGMFINRGGPVPSVHSFAQSTMGWTFLSFMGLTLLASLVVFAWRASSLKSRENLDSMLSRESAFLAQNVLFLTVAFVTLWGTIFPVFSQAAAGEVITVGAPFFNRVNGPILLGIVFLMGVGPSLPWRRASRANLTHMLRYPVLMALAIGVILFAAGIRYPAALLGLMLCVFVIAGVLREWVRGTRVRHRRGESYPIAFMRLLGSNRPRYGGYIVHLAIIMLAVGAIGSSFYSIQRDFAVSPGETIDFDSYSLKYIGVEQTLFADRQESKAQLELYYDGSYLGVIEPGHSFYPSFDIGATRAAIRSTLVEDFYVVPSEFGDDGEAVFRVRVNPLVWWMWASGPILVLGTVVALWPQRNPEPAKLRVPAGERLKGA